jgi:putative DNA primase/helicase
MSRAREIALALGGTGRIESGGRYRCRCPIHGDVNPSLTVQDYPARRDGLDVKCWSAGCDPIAIKRELSRRGLVEGWSGDNSDRPAIDPAELERMAAERRAEQRKRKELAAWIWRKAQPGAHSPELVRYLSECRAIDLAGGIPDCLRFEPRARIPNTDQHCPAMVASVIDALGEIIAVHVTFLRPDGSDKAEMEDARIIIGHPNGGAVRLAPATVELGVAEGIETALSAAELHGIPTWACLNTSTLQAFMVPPAVKRVVIFADRDKLNPKTGKRAGTVAAGTLATRLLEQRIACRIQYPALGFKDCNDELKARKRGERAA